VVSMVTQYNSEVVLCYQCGILIWQMATAEQRQIEPIQQAVARLLATSAPGHDLWLIGGFRYRFLDQSARISQDIDYHWDGDLAQKQAELVTLFQKRLLPDIKRRFALDGDVRPAIGPDADSPSARIVELAFWRPGVAYSRMEVPVEITRIVCLDPSIARTANGVVYRTASDADLAESKVIALMNRRVVEHRDLCDLFLFSNHFIPAAADRLQRKFAILQIRHEVISARLADLRGNKAYHTKALGEVIAGQLDEAAAANINAAGGAAIVLDAVLSLLHTLNLSGAGVP